MLLVCLLIFNLPFLFSTRRTARTFSQLQLGVPVILNKLSLVFINVKFRFNSLLQQSLSLYETYNVNLFVEELAALVKQTFSFRLLESLATLMKSISAAVDFVNVKFVSFMLLIDYAFLFICQFGLRGDSV